VHDYVQSPNFCAAPSAAFERMEKYMVSGKRRLLTGKFVMTSAPFSDKMIGKLYKSMAGGGWHAD
jgi:hypothetical protein